MKGRKKNNDIVNNYNSTTISLNQFNKLNINEKNEKLRDILADAYGNRNKVKSKTLLKIINLANEKERKIVHLENSISVENNGDELIFLISKTKVLPVILFYVGLLIFLSSAATFSYLGEQKRSLLNVDIDKDGVAELNIDLNKDEIADVNIDTNKDDKPDVNIDYMDNWTATFNIEKDGELFNKMNQDVDGDGKCDLNCDVDNDGWPDTNIDIDGDKVADMFLDPEDSGKASYNFDVDGDGTCDVHCDNDGDGKCDEYCVKDSVKESITEYIETIRYVETVRYIENEKIVDFDKNNPAHSNIHSVIPAISVEGQKVVCDDLYPTDQPGEDVKKECVTELVVKNLSTIGIRYNLDLEVNNNEYTSENFKYNVTSTNGGGNMNSYVQVPKSNTTIFKNVLIPRRATQTYRISFIIEGTNAEQNYDANRSFSGQLKVKLNNH